MLARTLLLTLSALAAATMLAGCADDPDESADTIADDPMLNDSSAMCIEGAEDCDDTPTMETVEDPTSIGT